MSSSMKSKNSKLYRYIFYKGFQKRCRYNSGYFVELVKSLYRNGIFATTQLQLPLKYIYFFCISWKFLLRTNFVAQKWLTFSKMQGFTIPFEKKILKIIISHSIDMNRNNTGFLYKMQSYRKHL